MPWGHPAKEAELGSTNMSVLDLRSVLLCDHGVSVTGVFMYFFYGLLCDRDFKRFPQTDMECPSEPWMHGIDGKPERDTVSRNGSMCFIHKPNQPYNAHH